MKTQITEKSERQLDSVLTVLEKYRSPPTAAAATSYYIVNYNRETT